VGGFTRRLVTIRRFEIAGIAVTEAFEQARTLFIEGVAHFEAGRLAPAEQCFEHALRLAPDRVSVRINLAATRLRLGRPGEALAELQALLAAEPRHLDAWLHAAAALSALGRDAEALPCADKVLAAEPGNGPAWHRRGLALERLRRFDEAAAAFAQAAALLPSLPDAWFRLGQLQHRLGRLDDALSSFDRLLALNPARADACSQRGAVLQALGRKAEAAAAFEAAIALGADAELQRFFLGALGRGDGPPSAPRSYVQALFDDYADGFDHHLVQVLGYQAHQRLVTPLAQLHAQPFDSALDLGCGTGLCGPLLRAMVRRLEGLDLSQPMLDRAAARGVYDALHRHELVEHLRTTAARHDLVLAADVFIYVGALETVFEAVMRVLRPGGLFCFSVELAADAQRPVVLTAEMRYAHAPHYLQGLARQHGLRWLQALQQPIRQHQRQTIPGLYVYLQRPSPQG
jgi:predicted TPR repeat methyltransferase